MPRVDVLSQVKVNRTPRLLQLEGMFDLPAEEVSTFSLEAELPLEEQDWTVGLITGPSGTGKTTLARNLWGEDKVRQGFLWPKDRSVVDAFPKTMSVKDVVAAMSSVGFSSPPAWLRPYHCLSTGEKFRVTLARCLCETAADGLTVFDEFTSVVDRGVAKVASAALSRYLRRDAAKAAKSGATPRRFVAVTCHHDVEEWLQPDWVFSTLTGQFTRRLLRRRPEIELKVEKCPRNTWELFRRHHYLSGSLSTLSKCFLGTVGGEPACFTAVVSFPHPRRPGWREHRTVCLPDWQGVGLGSAMSDFIAGCLSATGKPYRSVTSHPAMIAHRYRSPLWKAVRNPSLMPDTKRQGRGVTIWGLAPSASKQEHVAYFNQASAAVRLTTTFEYVGPKLLEHARGFGLLMSQRGGGGKPTSGRMVNELDGRLGFKPGEERPHSSQLRKGKL